MKTENSHIIPKCKHERNYFIEIDGMFLPCCWLATDGASLDDLLELYKYDYDKLFLTNNDPESIMLLWDKIEERWADNPLPACVRHCGKDNKHEHYFMRSITGRIARATQWLKRYIHRSRQSTSGSSTGT